MGYSAQVLEAEQCFTRATILAGHTHPLEAVLLLAQFVPARTELPLGVARKSLAGPLPCSRNALPCKPCFLACCVGIFHFHYLCGTSV